LEDKLIDSRIRLNGHALRITEERITKKVLNITIKGKNSTGRLRSRWEKGLGNVSCGRKNMEGCCVRGALGRWM
jgi:hypothetical protein